VLLRGFRFEHARTEQSVTIRGMSYAWAGLFGAGYVAWLGYGSVLQAVAINLAFAVGVVLLVGVTTYFAPLPQFLVLVVGLPVAILLQGGFMISLIRAGFRRRGWMIRTAD
jgi:hypothetical protein